MHKVLLAIIICRMDKCVDDSFVDGEWNFFKNKIRRFCKCELISGAIFWIMNDCRHIMRGSMIVLVCFNVYWYNDKFCNVSDVYR